MNALPPTEREIIDREHLKLLSIFHYVQGAVHVLFSFLLIFHFVLGLIMTFVPHFFGNGPGQGPPAWVGLIMSGFSGCFMLMGWLFGGLTIYSGICIKQRKYRTFSLVMAVINCLSVPFGTVLGVFTFMVLSRESVRRIYLAASSGTPEA